MSALCALQPRGQPNWVAGPKRMAAFPRYGLQSGSSAFVKSFGRRQAYESPRGTNPRATGGELWGFRLSGDPDGGQSAPGRGAARSGRVTWICDRPVIVAEIGGERGSGGA